MTGKERTDKPTNLESSLTSLSEPALDGVLSFRPYSWDASLSRALTAALHPWVERKSWTEWKASEGRRGKGTSLSDSNNSSSRGMTSLSSTSVPLTLQSRVRSHRCCLSGIETSIVLRERREKSWAAATRPPFSTPPANRAAQPSSHRSSGRKTLCGVQLNGTREVRRRRAPMDHMKERSSATWQARQGDLLVVFVLALRLFHPAPSCFLSRAPAPPTPACPTHRETDKVEAHTL